MQNKDQININDILIIGMSPGNGYFKQEVINKLLPFGLNKYKNIIIFIPDIPAIATYVALGYPENIARGKKAISQGNNFRNRIQKTIQEKNLDTDKIYIVDWQQENIEQNKDYKEVFNYLHNLYINNNDFKKDINSATEAVLMNNPFRKKEITLQDIEKGTHYILSEFAFMMFLPKHLPEYSDFIYGYHNPWPVWENFIDGKYDGKKKENLKFILLPDFS
jgi:cyclo(L-tyrosyl-L-tyrosyl) synthase